jgi:hypothetical protein
MTGRRGGQPSPRVNRRTARWPAAGDRPEENSVGVIGAHVGYLDRRVATRSHDSDCRTDGRREAGHAGAGRAAPPSTTPSVSGASHAALPNLLIQ